MLHPTLHNFSLQAGGSHYPNINPKMQEAFARMIIEKCAELADQAHSTPWTVEFSKPSEVIRTYFGLDNEHTTNS